jgi:2'-5' RNA ligase
VSRALFAAWRPDTTGRGRLAELAAALAGARPASGPRMQMRRPDQWHVTLCFLGQDVAETATDAVRVALADVATRIPPHAFTIERIAYWRHSGAVVALPHACIPLQALCDATRDAARRCGIRPEATTQPHVTLAYLGRGLHAQPWLEGVDCGATPLEVGRFELLFSAAGRYGSLGGWPLSGESLPPEPLQGSLL